VVGALAPFVAQVVQFAREVGTGQRAGELVENIVLALEDDTTGPHRSRTDALTDPETGGP
jgi:hypothetical protein